MPSEKELLQKELKAINWKEVDEYPSVADCENIDNKAQRQQCFFEVLTQLIQQKLSSDTLSVLYPKLDTIEVKVTIFPNATMQFEPQFPKDSVAYDRIKIDSILKERLVNFPKVNPAIKRGVPVKTQFPIKEYKATLTLKKGYNKLLKIKWLILFVVRKECDL